MARFTDEQRWFVETARIAHLATVNPDGSPQVVPVCFAFDGERFFSVIDQKPKRATPERLRRVRNIAERPAVSLVVDRYSEDWGRLGFVLVSGRAELLWQGPVHGAALRLLREKYPQYRAMTLEDRPVIAITPVRLSSWGSLAPA